LVAILWLALPSPGLGQSEEHEYFLKTKKQAQQGDAESEFALGVCYEDGFGVNKDSKEGLRWVRMAANQGVAPAQGDLGDRYSKGIDVPRDFAEAFKWYSRAARQGDATAECSLGLCYENSQGVPQNYVEAYKWLNLSAAQTHDAVIGVDKDSVEEVHPRKILDALTKLMTPYQIVEAQRLSREFLARKEGR